MSHEQNNANKDKKACLVVIVVLGLLVGLGSFVYTQMMEVADTGTAISDGLITRYVGLLEDRRFDEAYKSCLSEAHKKQITPAAFAAAHAARHKRLGALQGWKSTTFVDQADLSGEASLIGIKGVLHYANRDVFVLYEVNPAKEPHRIEKSFGSAGASSSLSEGVW